MATAIPGPSCSHARDGRTVRTAESPVPRSVAAGTGCCVGRGSVAGVLHDAEEGAGLAQGVGGGVDVDAVGVGGFGGGGHLGGGAVGGGDFGVGDDGGVGGLGLGAGGAVEVVEFGRVGGVDLVLDDDHVGGRGGGAGDVAAQVPVVEVLAGLGAGRAGDQGEVAAGGLDDLEPAGVGELAELLHVLCRVLLFGQRGLGPVLQVVHDPGVGRGDRVAGNVGGELGVGAVDQHAG